MAIIFALMAATLWAITTIFVRLGLRHMPSNIGTFISLVVSFLTVFALALTLNPKSLFALPAVAFMWFALHGVVNFLGGRFLNFTGVSMAGATRASPLVALSPLFAMVLAMVFLKERPSGIVVAGTVAIVLGIILIVSERRGLEASDGN